MKKLFFSFVLMLFVPFFYYDVVAQEMSREDILKYALDSEVAELINTLIEEGNTEYTEELQELFLRTKNSTVRESIFKLFADQKNPALEGQCVEILKDPYEERKSLVAAAADYAGAVPLPSALPALHSLVNTENYDYAAPAVRAIGKAGTKEDAVFLAGLLDMEFFDNEKQRLVFRQDIMAAISNLDASDIREKLVSLVQNEDENMVIRASAAAAIGKMAYDEDVDTLVSLFNATDPVLRAAAVSSLSNFDNDTARNIVLEGFKDSYYKVRLEALSSAEKMDLKDAVPYIIYRAKTDPVESVKMRSYEVLGKIGDPEGISFLSEILKNDNGADKFRAKAADVLLNYDFDTSYPDVAEIAEKILPDEKKRWLCYELGKSIAKIKNQRTSDLASLYLSSPDSLTQNLGLDMYERNRYPSLKSVIQELSENEKAGAVQRRAIKILENDTPSDSGSSSSSTPVNGKETSEGVKASPSTPSPSVSSPEDSPKPSGETYIESSGEAEELKTDAKETSSEVTDFTSASFDENLWAD